MDALQTALHAYAWAVAVLTALLLVVMAAQRLTRRQHLRRDRGRQRS